jgi:hypothetical protein
MMKRFQLIEPIVMEADKTYGICRACLEGRCDHAPGLEPGDEVNIIHVVRRPEPGPMSGTVAGDSTARHVMLDGLPPGMDFAGMVAFNISTGETRRISRSIGGAGRYILNFFGQGGDQDRPMSSPETGDEMVVTPGVLEADPPDPKPETWRDRPPLL